VSYASEPPDESPATFFTHHVVVPAAVIAMVASFLFYLVDVRSAYLGGGQALKWIGFCFAVATVLIERYGRSSGDDAYLQGFYTWALAGATAFVMLVSPWETQRGNPWETLANLVIVAAVWHFATRVTRGLSPEAGSGLPKRRLFDRDLLSIEPWQNGDPRTTASRPSPPLKTPPAVPRNPAATVARLAAGALLAFAVGEPVLLAASPRIGERALAAVVIFLFSTGVVLAAGSALGALRRVEAAGGYVSPRLVPGRVALAALLLGMVLASALAMPGLRFQGTGELRPPITRGEGFEQDRGYQQTEDSGQPSPTMPGEIEGNEAPSKPGDLARDSSQTPSENSPSSGRPKGGGLLGLLAAAGKWLRIPLILALLGVGLWGLLRLWPLLKGWRGKASNRWRALLARLAALLSRLPRPRRQDGPPADPLTGLETLLNLPDREAVLAAYHRFLALLETLGHTRSEKSTPYEILYGLPPYLRLLEPPARDLTDLYVLAAYAAEPVEAGARERAVTALEEMRGVPNLTPTLSHRPPHRPGEGAPTPLALQSPSSPGGGEGDGRGGPGW
jgi:hypothetical protein